MIQNSIEFLSYLVAATGTIMGIVAAVASFLFRVFLIPHIQRMQELEKQLNSLLERLTRLEAIISRTVS